MGDTPMRMIPCPRCQAENSVKRQACYQCQADLYPQPPAVSPTAPAPDYLEMKASIVVSDLDNAARAELEDLDAWPLAQIVEVMDGDTCPLCEAVDGMLLDRRSPEYERWRKPSHDGCRRTIAYVGADEVELGPGGKPQPVTPDFVEPPRELIEKYGTLMRD